MMDLLFHYHNAFLCLSWQRRLKALRPTANFIIFISSDPIDSAAWIVKIESLIYSSLLPVPLIPHLSFDHLNQSVLFGFIRQVNLRPRANLKRSDWLLRSALGQYDLHCGCSLAPGLWLLRSSLRPLRFVWSQEFSARCEHCCNFISRWPPEMMTLHPNVYAPVSWKLRAIFCLISVLFLIVIFSRLK